MGSFLEKLKLERTFTLDLNIDKKTFVKGFKKIVDHSKLGAFSYAFERLDFSDNQYKGKISTSHFELRKRLKLFELNKYKPSAFGRMKETETGIILHIVIEGFGIKLLMLLVGVILFSFVLFIQNQQNDVPILFILFFLLMAIVGTAITFFQMRKSVRTLEESIRRDFNSIADTYLEEIKH